MPTLSFALNQTFITEKFYFSTPPIICGYNTGQHMWVPASDQCNQISMDIDTANTGTTRKWEIKVTQHECDSLAAPDIDCLQYLYSESGIIFHYFNINPFLAQWVNGRQNQGTLMLLKTHPF